MESNVSTKQLMGNKNKSAGKITPCGILLGVAFFCVAMTTILPQQLLSLMIVVITVLLCFYDGVFLLYPIMIFYFSQLGLLFGISVYRIYTLIVIGNLLLQRSKRGGFHVLKWSFLPCVIYVIYCMLVVASRALRTGLFAIMDVLCCALIIANYLSDEIAVKNFFKVYVFTALCAYLTGVLGGNAQTYLTVDSVAADVEFSRFMATFEDPNYMGFFYTIAVWAVIALKLFAPKWRWVMVIALYVMMLSSASITAILTNLLLWPIYLLLAKKMNLKAVVALLAAVLLLFGLYYYGLANPTSKTLGLVSLRIQEKLENWKVGNMAEVTTGRTDLSAEHLAFFWQQPFWRLLIGGYEVNRYYITPGIHGAAHNEYVDLLLNVGLLGTLIMLGSMFAGTFVYYKRAKKNNDQVALFKLLSKVVWLIYVAGLTVFLDYRFMVPFMF